jgi:hypothetical protein
LNYVGLTRPTHVKPYDSVDALTFIANPSRGAAWPNIQVQTVDILHQVQRSRTTRAADGNLREAAREKVIDEYVITIINYVALMEGTMAKYEQLSRHLESLDTPRWTATFQEIEDILGFQLPPSAYTYPAWWANQSGHGHSHSLSWQSVGWNTVELDISNERVSFFRLGNAPKGPAPREPSVAGGLTMAQAKAGLAIQFGVLPENIEITIKG